MSPTASFDGLGMSLGNLARLSMAETRSISAENPDGARGGGGRSTEGLATGPARELGVGWKVRPCIDLAGHATVTLADIAGRLTFSDLSGLFSLSWDEATTAEIPEPMASALCQTTTPEWPHTFVVPRYATMGEYKHLPPANHFHMVQGLSPARLEYWMDLNCVLSQATWVARPAYLEGVDRPLPLLYAANGGENAAKLMLGKKL